MSTSHLLQYSRFLSFALLAGGLAACQAAPAPASATEPTTAGSATPSPVEESPVIDHEVVAIDGATVSLSDYRGTVMLIVNTASQCGYTPQLAGLQELHTRYAERGFTVLGFPCNDFGGQEPGSAEEIQTFCSGQYGVTFPLFDKVAITRGEPSPLYRTLQEQTPEGIRGPVRWNFTKFLVGADGRVIARFESGVAPDSPELIAAIEAALPR
jgi:glutathione peroxidase